MSDPKYSLIIPVFNSSKTIKELVEKSVAMFKKYGFQYEIVLVNDGSTDSSWEIIKDLAKNNQKITSIDLLKNFGQHSATMCGIAKSKGTYMITMDDDLQNQPSDILLLINKINEGHDVVFASYKKQKQYLYRRIGSKIIALLNSWVFNKPKDLQISSFRCFSRQVANRILDYKTYYPYINGLLIMFSYSPTNVEVKHYPRKNGNSNYSLNKIFELTWTILFNYSSFPLRLTSMIGMVVAFLSFVTGGYFMLKAILFGTSVVGWASIVVLLSFLNGTILLILGMLGEYIIRILNQQSSKKSFYIHEIVNGK